MQRDQAYDNLRNLLLQEFKNKQLIATPAAVEDFVRLEAAKGLFIDDLIRMAESGMSGRDRGDSHVGRSAARECA
jgi:hypothetical protein